MKSQTLARAHATLSAIVNHSTLGRSDQAQEWLYHQLFKENRIALFFETQGGLKALKEYLEAIDKKASLYLETPANFAEYAEKMQCGLFLVRLTSEILARAKEESREKLTENLEAHTILDEKIKELAPAVSDRIVREGQKAFFSEYLATFLSDLKNGTLDFGNLSDEKLGISLIALMRVGDPSQIKNTRIADSCQAIARVLYKLANERLKNNPPPHGFIRTFCNKLGGDHARYAGLHWTVIDEKFPFVQATTLQGKDVVLDLSTGSLFIEGFAASLLPQRVLDNQDVARLFPDVRGEPWKVYDATDEQDRDLRMYVHPKNDQIRLFVPSKVTPSGEGEGELFTDQLIGDVLTSVASKASLSRLLEEPVERMVGEEGVMVVLSMTVNALSPVVGEALADVLPGAIDTLPKEHVASLTQEQKQSFLENGIKQALLASAMGLDFMQFQGQGKENRKQALKSALDEQLSQALHKALAEKVREADLVTIERKHEGQWHTYHRFKIQDDVESGEALHERSDDLPPSIGAVIGNRTCWRARGGDNILIFNPGGDKLFGCYKKDELGNGLFCAEDGGTPLEPTEEACAPFTTIEEKERLSLNGENGLPSHIYYRNLALADTPNNLSYKIKGSLKRGYVIESENFPGWTLAPIAKPPGSIEVDERGVPLPDALPPGFTSYQMLEKAEAQKVLIPGRELVLQEGKEIGPKGTYATRGRIEAGAHSSPVYEYTVDPKTNRLQSSSAEANFYLAYLSFVHGDHDAALYYLKKAKSGVGSTERFAIIGESVGKWEAASESDQAIQLKLLVFAEKARTKGLLEGRQKERIVSGRESPIPRDEASPYLDQIKALVDARKPTCPISLSLAEQEFVSHYCEVDLPEIDKMLLQAEAGLQNVVVAPPSVTPEVSLTTSSFIVGEEISAAVNSAFKRTRIPDRDIDETFFEELERSKDKAIARVAKAHREDLNAAKASPTYKVTISSSKAKQLISKLREKQEEVAAAKATAITRALAILAPKSNAAREAISRQLGEERSITIDQLVQLFIAGELKSKSSREAFNRAAKTELKDFEIDELESLVLDYMATYTDLQHIGRCIDAGHKYVSSVGYFTSGDPALAQSFYELMTTNRGFQLMTKTIGASLEVDDFAALCKYDDIQQAIVSSIPSDQGGIRGSLEHLFSVKPFQFNLIARELNKLMNLGQPYQKFLANLDSPDHRYVFEKHINAPDYKEMVALEYTTGFILRHNQIATYREMLEDPYHVRQLAMGGGKSKVLLPLLAKQKATGQNLVALLLPDALYETNRRDLDITNRELFGQEMYCFEYNRYADINAADLKEIRLILLKTIRDKGFIASTKSSLLSFRDAYLSKLIELSSVPSEERDELIAQVSEMGKIFKLMKERMDILADEIDEVLDVRKEVNFAAGEAAPIHEIKSNMALECIDLIDAANGGNLAQLREDMKLNTQADMLPQVREKALKELAGAFFDKHHNRLTNLGLNNRREFVAYVTGSSDCTEMPSSMKELQKSTKKDEIQVYREVAAFKALVCRGFKMTLTKTCNVHYGRDPDPLKADTIPYKASNTPAVGSQFDDEIERLAYTLQDYYHRDVKLEAVKDLVGTYTKEVQKQLLTLKKLAEPGQRPKPGDTEAAGDFMNMIEKLDPSGEILNPSLQFYATSDDGVNTLRSHINSTPILRARFCKLYAIDRKLKLFPDQVSSKAEDLVDMVHAFGGFTGTPWNRHTYHDAIKAEPNLGVDGRTYKLLLEYDSPVEEIVYKANNPIRSIIDAVSFEGEESVRAVIDTGALLRGFTNKQFIDKAMEGRPDSAVGIYFNEAGQIVGQTVDGAIIPSSKLKNEALDTRITLYDQAHTVGADIKQDRKAIAAVTVSGDTKIRDLFQAVWRLRQLHEEQRVKFLVTPEVRGLMGKGPGEKIKIQDLLGFCLKNEAMREADDNYRAESAKMTGHGQRVLFDGLVSFGAQLTGKDPEHEVQKINQIVAPLHSMLVKKRSGDESFDEYAIVSSTEDAATQLTKIKKRTSQKLEETAKSLEGNFRDYLIEASQTIADRDAKPADWFPEEVATTNRAEGATAEAETEAQVEVNTLMLIVAEQEEDTEEPAEESVNQASGVNQVAIEPSTTKEVENLSRTTGRDLNKSSAFRRLCNVLGCFDDMILMGSQIEGKLTQWNTQYDSTIPKGFTDFAKYKSGELSNETEASKRAKIFLHSSRQPIGDALIFKRPDGRWMAFFATPFDSYPIFNLYPAKIKQPASFVSIGASKPISITENDAFLTLDPKSEDRKQFMNLFVQLKFLRGEFDFNTKEELEALEAWFKEKGVKEMRLFFEKMIRPTKGKREQLGYRDSTLKLLFDKMEREAAG